MNFRLRTSKTCAEILKTLQASTGLTPNVLARIAVGLSLSDPNQVVYGKTYKDPNGLEFHRDTLTGDHDFIFKALIRQHAHRSVADEEYFPDLFAGHLERGAKKLIDEYSYAGNYEKLISNLLYK